MMVTFVSQCEKNALKKTRRVLDAFADRIGDNTWQTLITEEGLNTVKKMLRKTASKSTAVSCHWIRTRSRSQLIWIVGNKSRFNQEGIVPVNRTQRNLLKSELENDWRYLPLLKSLTALAALLHDWGKASELFQDKLLPGNAQYQGDPIRHEWVSLLLFRALVYSSGEQNDQDWLVRLSAGDLDETQLRKALQTPEQKPFADLPPIAQWVAWLVVSHHRLPSLSEAREKDHYKGAESASVNDMLKRIDQFWGYENGKHDPNYQKKLQGCLRFPNGLLKEARQWQQKLKRWAKQLLEHQSLAQQCLQDKSYRLLLQQARLCLMLGDHYYSSQDKAQDWRDETNLYANTDRKTSQLKQKLDEHLVGVAHYAVQVAHLLPAFETELPVVEDVQSLRKLSPKNYAWQDKAVQKIHQWHSAVQDKKRKQGFFAVNMASTGCGKTFANAKIMRALSPDQKSLRFILALGLRTLTLQTGHEYRQRVGLDSSELAVLIGSRAVMELSQRNQTQQEIQPPQDSGSESQEALLSDEVDFDCAIPEQPFTTVLTQERDKQFLYAPVLACTIDHLMAATETKRGGRYILPTLRLMGSDLVIDEIDDFTGDDLIAIGRLIHLAGMLGRKVMISSATIPPSMAEGYLNAYREGWELYCQNRDAQNVIACAWIDEFATQLVTIPSGDIQTSNMAYVKQHKQFVESRVTQLQGQPAKRKATIAFCQDVIDSFKTIRQQDEVVVQNKQEAYFRKMFEQALLLHGFQYKADPKTGLNVSFGLMRMANIRPCVSLTRYLLQMELSEDTEVRVMAYHSQQVMLLRSEQECYLDGVLNRKQPDKVLQNPVVRGHLTQVLQNQPNVKNVLFILVATPVEEVGRDHDLDWAVVEPSSYRSIIQLAGRVRRHRPEAIENPNIALMQYNWKGVLQAHDETKRVFENPGFESNIRLKQHNLDSLLNADEVAQRVDAIPRIQQPEHLNSRMMRKSTVSNTLAELEHISTWKLLANYKSSFDYKFPEDQPQTGPHTMLGWLRQHWYLTSLSQVLTPFRQGEPTLKVFLTFDQSRQRSTFCEKDDEGYAVERESVLNIERLEISPQAMQRLWLIRNFDESCAVLAQEKEMSQRAVSLRYGELGFRFDEKRRYFYNDQFGLIKK